MRGFLVGIAATITALLVWALLVIAGTTNGWFRDAMAPAGDTRAFMDATVSEIEADYHGNVAFLLIEDGQIFDGFTASVGRPVSIDTLFQVASLSKWVTAWGVMTLVEAGRLDLDVPVSRYLTRWALPESEFNNDGVTVRRLLSHTAGLTDGLGHNGFAPGVDVQRLEDYLTQALDAETGTSGGVHVSVEPGSEFIYSGGGFNLLQLIIEEVSGATFHEYMREAVFVPLGMSQSTYFIDDENSPNLAPFYDLDGSPATHFRFTSLGATSLYTTARDLFRFVTAHLPGSHGEPVGRGVLTAETVRLMRKPHASTMGIDVWGLGTILYSSNNEGDVIFGHDGQGGLQSTRQPDSTLGLATASSFWRLGIGFSLQGSRANGASGKQEESISRSFLSRS